MGQWPASRPATLTAIQHSPPFNSPELHVPHGARHNQRPLGVEQHVCHRVQSHLLVRCVHTHRLCNPHKAQHTHPPLTAPHQWRHDSPPPLLRRPRTCLPMADWYVLRGDWLWSGKGMMDAQMPRIMDGWISQCVYVVLYVRRWISCGSIAIIALSSSCAHTQRACTNNRHHKRHPCKTTPNAAVYADKHVSTRHNREPSVPWCPETQSRPASASA